MKRRSCRLRSSHVSNVTIPLSTPPVTGPTGQVFKRIPTGGSLSAPRGVTVAPSGFGSLCNDLLIGNFGKGEIRAMASLLSPATP